MPIRRVEYGSIEEKAVESKNKVLGDYPEILYQGTEEERTNTVFDLILIYRNMLMKFGKSGDGANYHIYKEIEKGIHNARMEYYESRERARKNEIRMATDLLIDARYPEDIRIKMMKACSEADYKSAIDMASQFDFENRERPHKGKTGPDPFTVDTSQHIDYEKVAKGIS